MRCERPASPFVADFIGSINFLNGTCTPEKNKGPHPLMAVRPEDVSLKESGTSSPDGVWGEIRDIEFQGSFYRVTVLLLDQKKQLTDQTMMIDLSGKEVRSLQLEKGKKYVVDIPSEKLISFGEDIKGWKQEKAI